MLPIILAIKDEDDRNYVADIYEQYKDLLFSVANKVLNHNEDALDCVQDVIIALIDNLQRYQTWDHKHQMCFLSRCCKNAAINKYKDKLHQLDNEFSITNIETNEASDIEDRDANVETIFITEEMRKIVVQGIKEMNSKYADLLLFKYYFNMKNIEISKMLDMPINTVNVQIARAKSKLMERVGDRV